MRIIFVPGIGSVRQFPRLESDEGAKCHEADRGSIERHSGITIIVEENVAAAQLPRIAGTAAAAIADVVVKFGRAEAAIPVALSAVRLNERGIVKLAVPHHKTGAALAVHIRAI